MPRPDRTIPQRKMLIGHEVIDNAVIKGQETDLGEFLAEAQMDFELFLLLDNAEDYKNPVYEDFVRGFGLFFEPRKIVTKDTLSWFTDEEGFSDFHAIMSEHEDVAELASEMSSALEIYKEGGYAKFRKAYNIFLTYKGQTRLTDERLEEISNDAELAIDEEIGKKVPNLKQVWEEAQQDRLVQNLLQTVPEGPVKEELLDGLLLHFRYAIAGTDTNRHTSLDNIYASLYKTEIPESEIKAAITAIEYHAANAIRPN